MPIIAARRYAEGRVTDPALVLDGHEHALPAGRGFDWIELEAPSEAEMAQVAAQYALHPLAVEDALNPNQMPKLDIYGRHLFVVARGAEIGGDEALSFDQTALFLGPDYVVVVRFDVTAGGTGGGHQALRERLEADRERLAEGSDYVAHAVLDALVDRFQPLTERLEEMVQELEEGAIERFPDQATIRRIFRLRRQLRRFERICAPLEGVCERLADTELPGIDPAARVWFRDVLDHVRRALARMRGLKDTLASIVETASLLEQHRQGDMTRTLAAWAAILAVPTAIAGIYGMNFEVMPELHFRYGYPTVLAAILAICGGLFARFKRIGWL